MNPHQLVIERLQVEGGFLSGLDLAFGSGLTVLIGPRGSGKTSALELLRFALGIEAHTPESNTAADAHARSALGSGQATLTVRIHDQQYSLTRTAEQRAPRLVERYPPPIVLSQGEVETIGLSARARLALLDGFRANDAVEEEVEGALDAVSSFAREHAAIRRDIQEMAEEIATLRHAMADANAVEDAYAASRATLKGAKTQQEELEALSVRLAARSVATSAVQQATENVASWASTIGRLRARPPAVPEWPSPDPDGKNPLAQLNKRLEAALARIAEVERVIRESLETLRETTEAEAKAEEKERDEFRKLQNELEQLQAGAGEIAKRFADLQAKQSRVQSLEKEAKRLAENLTEVEGGEAMALDELDRLRAQIHASRAEAARSLEAALGPQISVTVEQSGLTNDYANAIAEALRGSGMQYNTLARELSNRMSPRELSEVLRRGEVEALVEAGGLTAGRARKVVDALAKADLGPIMGAELRDLVTLRLLDGGEYKPTTRLSTGQRCTVVLAILLSHRDRPIVVDQPEDNLDNAFVVETLVRSIVSASSATQLIVTTHNANIPVLGDASKVVVLGSDGERGFIRHEGPLTDRSIVKHITNVMEGGREAFERRAKFYSERGA